MAIGQYTILSTVHGYKGHVGPERSVPYIYDCPFYQKSYVGVLVMRFYLSINYINFTSIGK